MVFDKKVNVSKIYQWLIKQEKKNDKIKFHLSVQITARKKKILNYRKIEAVGL